MICGVQCVRGRHLTNTSVAKYEFSTAASRTHSREAVRVAYICANSRGGMLVDYLEIYTSFVQHVLSEITVN